jgi:KDO2-lipid IV(A) lauroyltransferase
MIQHHRYSDWREFFIYTLMLLCSKVPLNWLQRFGAWLGTLIAHSPNRQRRNALINLAICFPELPPAALIALRHRNFQELGKTYLEISHFWMRSTQDLLSMIHEVRGQDLLQPSPQGLIVLSPHLGAWELAGLYLATCGQATVLYKPQKLFDHLILQSRRQSGATFVPTSPKGVKALMRALQQGHYVGILPDQTPRQNKGALFAPFFGWPTYTMLLINRLARKTGAPVIFMFAQRLSLQQGGGYCLHCLPAAPEIASDQPSQAARALNQGIEHCIRICPEQYLWPYRRFRERPIGIPKLYTGSVFDRKTLQTIHSIRQFSAHLN